MNSENRFTLEGLQVASDPEFFLTNGAKEIVPSFDLLGGNKDFPNHVAGGTLQEDNVMAEVAPLPARTEDEFVSNFTTVMDSLRLQIAPHDLAIYTNPFAVMSEGILSDARAHIVGCSPDYNAWTMQQNPIVRLSTDKRFAGGHIHFSHPILELPTYKIIATKLCDLHLGIPAVMLDPDTERRQVYGKAGAHRPTTYPDGSHGVEYRVLSNFWTKDETHLRWAYRQITKVITETIARFEGKDFLFPLGDSIRYAIDNNDKREADYLINKYNLELL